MARCPMNHLGADWGSQAQLGRAQSLERGDVMLFLDLWARHIQKRKAMAAEIQTIKVPLSPSFALNWLGMCRRSLIVPIGGENSESV